MERSTERKRKITLAICAVSFLGLAFSLAQPEYYTTGLLMGTTAISFVLFHHYFHDADPQAFDLIGAILSKFRPGEIKNKTEV